MTENIYKLRRYDDIVVIDLLNEIDSSASLKVLIELSEELMNKGDKYFVMNLEKVTFIDSSAVGWLIRLKKKSKVLGGDLKLLNPPDFILRLLGVLRLEKFIEVFKNETMVLGSFKKICPNCEKKIDLKDSFCRFCGERFL